MHKISIDVSECGEVLVTVSEDATVSELITVAKALEGAKTQWQYERGNSMLGFHCPPKLFEG